MGGSRGFQRARLCNHFDEVQQLMKSRLYGPSDNSALEVIEVLEAAGEAEFTIAFNGCMSRIIGLEKELDREGLRLVV